ncbi:MAG: response regulator [Flavobacterium sp.]
MMYKKVMVIDDSHFDRLIAEKVIQLSKFADDVITIDSALEGIDYLNSNANNPEEIPEIIFLDIRMPIVDGFGFLKKFENSPQLIHEKCKIFMLSSSLDPKDIKRANKCKYVHGFISKPLSKEKLVQLMKL